jgi:hypothetical protein
MATLAEILENRKDFPDDRKITMTDGVEVTLGELRSGYMMDRDYRQKTQTLARDREAFSREKAEFEHAREDAEKQLAALAERVVTPNAPARQQEAEWESYLERDPIARRLHQQYADMDKRMQDYDERIKRSEESLRQQAQVYVADQHRAVMARLKASDPSLNEQELVQYAQSNYLPRLDHAYRLMTEDRRVKDAVTKAKEDALREGYEKAKRELAQPMLPQRRVAAPLAESAPKTFEEAAEAALRDPEILATMEGYSP